jgi:hypothetical protein
MKPTPKNPFCIVPAGKQCIIEPHGQFTVWDDSTYWFGIAYDENNPLLYLAVHLPPQYTWPEGQAAVIRCHTNKGYKMGHPYYIGYLGPEKMSSFCQILQQERGVTGLVIMITTHAESEVKEIYERYQKGVDRGPFTPLN